MCVNNAWNNISNNIRITYQLTQTERGLSGSGPWSSRLLYSER